MTDYTRRDKSGMAKQRQVGSGTGTIVRVDIKITKTQLNEVKKAISLLKNVSDKAVCDIIRARLGDIPLDFLIRLLSLPNPQSAATTHQPATAQTEPGTAQTEAATAQTEPATAQTEPTAAQTEPTTPNCQSSHE